MTNVYFDLTEELNAEGPIVALTSGQAVVYYRISREIELTTDPDRILALAPSHGESSQRPPVRAALTLGSRDAVVVELARETDRLQQEDRRRLEQYKAASDSYLRAFQAARIGDLALPEAHQTLCVLAERLLPPDPLGMEEGHGAAQ